MLRLGLFLGLFADFVAADTASIVTPAIPDSPVVADSALARVTREPVSRVYKALMGESRITYFIKHPLHVVEGFSTHFECQVELGADTLQAKVKVKAPVAAFDSHNSNRDSHTLELLEAFRYPFVEFVSDSVQRDGKGYRVFGLLDFHGVKKPVDFPVDWWKKDGKVYVEVEFKVTLTAHKVKRPTLMLVPTEDALRIKIHAVAKES